MRKISSVLLIVLVLFVSGVMAQASSVWTVDEVRQMAEESPIHASLMVFEKLDDPKEQEFVVMAYAEKLAQQQDYASIDYLASRLSYQLRNDFYGEVASWLVKLGQFEKAIEMARRIDYKPNREWALKGVAEVAAEQGKPELALELANEIQAGEKKNNLLRAIAESYARIDQLNEALKLVNDMSGTARDIALNRVAAIYTERGEFEPAKQVAGEIKDQHEHDFVWQQIALKYQELGQNEQAFQMLDHLINQDPYFVNRLQTENITQYIQSGQVDKAIALAKSFENDHFRNGAYAQIADMAAQQGDFDTAYEVLELVTVSEMYDASFMDICHEYALQGHQEEAIEIVLNKELRNEAFRDEMLKWMAIKLVRDNQLEWVEPVISKMKDEIQIEQVKIEVAKAFVKKGQYEPVKGYIDDILVYPQYAGVGLELCFALLDQNIIDPVLEISPKIKKVRYQVLVNLRAAQQYAELFDMAHFEQLIDQAIVVIRAQGDPRSEILMVDVANSLAKNGYKLKALEVVAQIKGQVEKTLALAMVYDLPNKPAAKLMMHEIATSTN